MAPCPARDRTVARVKEVGRRRWKKESGYHRQGTVENAFFRYKSDGLVFGATSIPWGSASLAPVSITLKETAALAFEIEQELPDGQFESGYRGEAVQVRVESSVPPPFDEGLQAFKLSRKRWLRSGEYSVSIATRAHAPISRVVELVAGQVTTIAGTLRLEEGARRIHGTARSESGEPVPHFDVSIELRDQPGRHWNVDYRDGRYICVLGIDLTAHAVKGSVPQEVVFEVGDVPPGEIEASVSSIHAPFSVAVRSIGTDGDVELVLVALDGEGTPGLGFRVAPGSVMPEFGVYARARAVDGRATLLGAVRDGRIVEVSDPSERDFEWAVSAWGFRTVYGTSRDFVPEGGGRFFATLRLERGFATRVFVHHTDGTPVGGIKILADRIPVGRTDSDGWIEVVLDEAPERIEVDPTELDATLPTPVVREGFYKFEPWSEIVVPR